MECSMSSTETAPDTAEKIPSRIVLTVGKRSSSAMELQSKAIIFSSAVFMLLTMILPLFLSRFFSESLYNALYIISYL